MSYAKRRPYSRREGAWKPSGPTLIGRGNLVPKATCCKLGIRSLDPDPSVAMCVTLTWYIWHNVYMGDVVRPV